MSDLIARIIDDPRHPEPHRVVRVQWDDATQHECLKNGVNLDYLIRE